MTNITITKRDGTKEPYNADLINKAIEKACVGLEDIPNKIMRIITDFELTLYNGISTEDIDKSLVKAAVQNIKEDTDYDVIATRIYLKTIYKKVLGDYEEDEEVEALQKKAFVSHIKEGVNQGILDKRMSEVFDLNKLSEAIEVSCDSLFSYHGLSILQNRYTLTTADQQPFETPQYLWMRVAMGFSVNEANPNDTAISFYEKLSELKYVSGGSSLISVGRPNPSMSNCYILEMHDSIDHIAKTVSDVMKLSKATGGIGLSITKLRAKGSPVRSNNTFSSGPIPFLHTIDSTLRAVSRGGKKLGALCFYMENWHVDFYDFLDLKQNTGDDYRRTKTANTAVYISDEFMKRVANDDYWYMFDPLETSELPELYGSEFSEKYNKYVEKAEAGEMKLWEKVKAREQYKDILMAMQTTSHPWLTWKDPINTRALNNNTGTIHSSNLCTEICLPQDGDNIAVCNLASVNLSRHIVNGTVDWESFEDTIRVAFRQLDNLVDVNNPPVEEARNADDKNRAVGLGIMGLADTLQKLKIPYESEECYDFIDKVMEFFSYITIDESANLAQEHGSYENFEGSMWSKGYVPYDTLEITERNRGTALTVDKGSVLDWTDLRKKVKQGMRNATTMAIAPTANIAHVAGTSPGIDPSFSNVFSRTTITGKYLDINTNLVAELKELGTWDEIKDDLISAHGDISNFDNIPEEVKAHFRTSFQTSPHAFIEVAARAQKWIDQALSRNMYLETRKVSDMMDIYSAAWDKGLKTTYYLHMKPRHTAEQSTVSVNKTKTIGKGRVGFGAVPKKASPTPPKIEVKEVITKEQVEVEVEEVQVNSEISLKKLKKDNKIIEACPVDPQERLLCEGCQ